MIKRKCLGVGKMAVMRESIPGLPSTTHRNCPECGRRFGINTPGPTPKHLTPQVDGPIQYPEGYPKRYEMLDKNGAVLGIAVRFLKGQRLKWSLPFLEGARWIDGGRKVREITVK